MSGDDKYMLCSMCKKNQAVIFSSKEDNGQRKMDGLCIPCARKQGINTDEILKAQNTALSQMQLKDVNNQLEGLFKNLAENLGNIDSIELGTMPINNINNDADDTDNDSEDLNDLVILIILMVLINKIIVLKRELKLKKRRIKIKRKNI